MWVLMIYEGFMNDYYIVTFTNEVNAMTAFVDWIKEKNDGQEYTADIIRGIAKRNVYIPAADGSMNRAKLVRVYTLGDGNEYHFD